jgi:hypothetical protein
MKRLLYILTLFILTVSTAKGQTMDKMLQKLMDNKLIEQKQISDFEKLLKRNETQSNSTYLQTLFQTEFKKLTGEDYLELGVRLNFGNEKPNAVAQTKINEELSLFLLKIKNCSLITDKQFNNQTRKIQKNDYTHILQFLPDLANQSAYEEWLNPDNLLIYSEELFTNKVISEQSFNNLKNEITSGKITSHYQLVDYFKSAIFFDLAKYSNDPSIYLEQIHKEVSRLLPELTFTNFRFKIEVDSAESFNDYIAHKVIISFKVNNKTYRQKSFIAPDDIGENGNFLGKIDDQEFYQIFNKILADNQSPYRLHEIKSTYQYGQPKSDQFFGIVALSKDQVKMFRNLDSYIQISYEKFKNSVTSEQIVTAIRGYQQIGLLSHLTESQIVKAKATVSEQENSNFNTVLSAFPDVIHIYGTELGNLKDPYAELIREYKRISHNEFNPTEISDFFDIEKAKNAVVKFKIGNKTYSKTFIINGDWIDMDCFDFISSVVSEQHLSGKFYELYTGGQEASIIYLKNDQYNYLRINKLLVFADEEWQSEE